ncbi:MAG: Tim44 domain-containing protein [Deltaproteobacteria bacterium]|nr:Tim44 domain-containing protein [Deltaproteobacteria bacterium]
MKKLLIVLTVALFCASFTCDRAYARAGFGSGRSSLGSRGSRTFTPPAKPSAPNTNQTQQTPPPQQNPAYQAQPQPRPQGFFGGFGRSLAGGLIGGMIGGLLFSSLGYGATTGGFGGVGLFDILLIGLGVFLLIRFLRPKRSAEPYRAERGCEAADAPRPQVSDDFLKDLKRVDTAFDPEGFKKEASDLFVKVQAAWKKRDLGPVNKHLTDDIFHGMTNELEKAAREGSLSHLEKIDVKGVQITEAWQEEGLDFVTVRITAEALTHSTDASGNETGGGPLPVSFSEYWTFVREVWLKDWKLTAIQQEHA